ncbi:MAG: carbohydrate ABC transporter permease [Lachnospiraceae bacterium]|nr:carbohydrate ABC transporter permease [Lachnospiraceae bacterium]
MFFGLFTLACVLPFYYLFINTISDNDLVAKGMIVWLPKGIHWDNYVEILKINGLGRAALVTLARTVLGTFFTAFGTSFLGYALTRKELWKRKIWYRYVIITMYFNAGIIPWFITMKNLGLTNNFLAYILPGIVSPYSLMLFKTYCESIPDSLEESAELDGAGYFVRYTQIILPLSKPILATLVIFAAVNNWNAFMDTVFLMTDSKLFTLQYVLYEYLNEAQSLAASIMSMASQGIVIDTSKLLTPTSIKMTVSMVVVLPILFVYPFFQKYFAGGIMIGAVKG